MPDLALELSHYTENHCQLVAGIDEAGRGAIAGPVVAAAVILPLQHPDLARTLHQVDDSKKLSAARRQQLVAPIIETAIAWAVGFVQANLIDQIGIMPATRRAMMIAVEKLQPPPDFLLIDGRVRLSRLSTPQQSIIRGDSQSLSIASASILAKVARDRMMQELDEVYPPYGFGKHKGYGTAMHRAMLARLGPTPAHRLSFAPIRHLLL